LRRFWILGFTFASLSAQVRAQDSIPNPREFWLDEAQSQASAVGVDYRALVVAATAADTGALGKLLDLRLDGAGAEIHSEVLWALLRRWGDVRFAVVLLLRSTDVKSHVLCDLDFASPANWSRRFPRTFQLARHQAICNEW
jgi:hypothetical protein